MKQYEDFQMLYELDLASVNGGKINWGSVAGHCAGGAIIGGAFSGGLAAGIGCVVGSGKAIIGGL
ncbi:TPA: class IIb bacteriocin, lactobin A/cerein 7B family [Streptococcus equi subsp. zooepidemicus]|uniref:Bacteriocin subunit n=1 Tax=Streptococcus equi subsp. zooepidemicus TaxID=40041 RepID=A0A6D2L4G3_STRSZ|nr:class IIb bacteriocin, lactobin A/cerein 7B family [Streptococcus equi]KIS12138.1 bacteriocin subunit [Streptococcus equi subsp. zooepidemicus Sz105]AIA67189.1 TmhB bacteriocin enhancer peptide [Streptococcus equi subsp. zooepidemicus CY]KIQ75181.1 TmhB bacteriocin enhancer peptide [Streptococcus equi subsp. zooepidemicus]KIS06036.1 bacteriocin subunit [Streptococcus equi subsp. zooepidemicus Sz16]KIS16482.1 bacteriocin subunit [Streptococcus equi subsp. zooepidemicus SzAM35]